MSVLRKARDWVEGHYGWFIRRKAPWGVNLFHDLSYVQGKHEFSTVLDVGANIGQTARLFLKEFPSAEIHSFEPVAETYAQLCINIKDERFHAYHLAMGSHIGEEVMYVADDPGMSDMNALGRIHPLMSGTVHHSEQVRVSTLDEWCASQGVQKMSLLKVDAEGQDLEVLKGAQGLLRAGRIDFVLCEAGVDHRNELHVPLGELMDYMGQLEYGVYGIYEQVMLDRTVRPVVRRVNVLFIKTPV